MCFACRKSKGDEGARELLGERAGIIEVGNMITSRIPVGTAWLSQIQKLSEGARLLGKTAGILQNFYRERVYERITTN
jgi:hypothetical protein